MNVSIIIVHYKTYDLTLRCIQSLFKAKDDNSFEVVVVDNDSNDGAGEQITKEFPSIKWIYNSSNEGFGRANNLGAKHASGEYLLFLNSDMIVPEGTIAQCLNFMRLDAKIGALGPRLLNEDGSIQKSTYAYIGDHQELLKDNLLLDKLIDFKEPKIKAVMGSFLMIPSSVFHKIGGFDPDFFMYCEELDLCKRISDSNKEIVFNEEVYAIHKHGGSSGGSEWFIKQTYLSRSLLVYKHKGLFGYVLSHLIWYFNFATNILLMWFLTREYRRGFWLSQRGYFSNWLRYWTIPFIFTKRTGNGKKLLKRAQK